MQKKSKICLKSKICQCFFNVKKKSQEKEGKNHEYAKQILKQAGGNLKNQEKQTHKHFINIYVHDILSS